MNSEITSKVLGQLKQDYFPDWWKSEPIEIPFFNNQKLPITCMDFEPEEDKTFIEEADQALTYFLQLSSNDRQSVSEPVYRNCMDFLDAIEEDEEDEHFREIENINEIWNFVFPTDIFVSRRHRRDQEIYIHIACECGWEQEHGLQLVFRQGKKLTRVSGQDGHLTEADAYDIPDEEDELLSKFH